MHDFFISYNSADKTWAEWIAWELENAGYTTKIQAWDFRPGSNFVLEMQQAAADCTRTIAVLSPNYLASRFTQPEWAAAFAQDPTGTLGKLVPIRVRDCELRGLLPQIIYIDLVDVDESTARKCLLDGVNHERAKPTTPPAFPRNPGAATGAMTAPLRFPGSFPPIWNVSHSRNPNFTGRENELAQMHDQLSSQKTAALTQAIHGLGGVGKTQLAVEYAYRHASEYDLVWWMRAEESITLASDFARLAQPLDLPDKDAQDQRIVIEAVKNYLRDCTGANEMGANQSRPYLIIFDNANAPADIQPYLPTPLTGNVIITSRNSAWRAIANPLSVKTLPRDESIDFLMKRTGLPPRPLGEGRGEGSDADKLAAALGDLPLALEQAGAYIDAAQIWFADYLAMFERHRAELLTSNKPLDHDPVATTWDISFNAVAQTSPDAVRLLNLCAFFAPDDIPLNLIAHTVGARHASPLQTTNLFQRIGNGLRQMFSKPNPTQKQSDSFALTTALAALLRYSLITKKPNDKISIHRLVQAMLRDRMTDAECKSFAESAVTILDNAFPSGDLTSDLKAWDICAQLLDHALATADSAATLDIAPSKTGFLFNQSALYLNGRAQFMDAKQLFERALKIDEATFGKDHPNVARDVCNLGSVLHDLSDLNGARQCFERALEIGETTLGKDHPEVATTVNNLGGVLQDLGDLNGARQCYERALKILESNLGENHPQVATGINNLGGVLQDLGDLNGARQCYERALKIWESNLGENHPQVATGINNLGSLLYAQGDLKGAHENAARALKIWLQFLPPDHPDIKIARENLRRVEEEMNNGQKTD